MDKEFVEIRLTSGEELISPGLIKLDIIKNIVVMTDQTFEKAEAALNAIIIIPLSFGKSFKK
jgi:hypothetical protein